MRRVILSHVAVSDVPNSLAFLRGLLSIASFFPAGGIELEVSATHGSRHRYANVPTRYLF